MLYITVNTFSGASAKFSPRQQQVQNFPHTMVVVWLRVRISAGRALKERQCTLKGQARYVNVWGSVHWKGVYRLRDKDLGDQVHKFMHLIPFFYLYAYLYDLKPLAGCMLLDPGINAAMQRAN